MDDKTLDIEVHAPEKDDWVPVASLSQGTLDLVYLVARLGLVRLITGDRRPPLVFDDPFVTLDDARADRAVELLKVVASDFQVIYLTTSDRYDAAADAVVELLGPTAVDSSPVGAARLSDLLSGGAATVVFGLAAAVTWGSGDFGGGLLTRRTPLFGVVLASQLVGTVVALVLAVVRGESAPLPADVAWSVVAGLGRRDRDQRPLPGPGGRPDGDRGADHRGHRGAHPGHGRDRVRRPPRAAGAGRDRPGVRRGRPRLTSQRRPEPDRPAWVSRCLAGVAIGALGVAIAQISDGHVFGPLTVLRATEALLIGAIVLIGKRAWRPDLRLWPALAGVGILDMAGQRGVPPGGAGRVAGGRRGPVVALPGHDRRAGQRLPARARSPGRTQPGSRSPSRRSPASRPGRRSRVGERVRPGRARS